MKDDSHWALKSAICLQAALLAAVTQFSGALTNVLAEKGSFTDVNWELLVITTVASFIIHGGKPMYKFLNDELDKLSK